MYASSLIEQLENIFPVLYRYGSTVRVHLDEKKIFQDYVNLLAVLDLDDMDVIAPKEEAGKQVRLT